MAWTTEGAFDIFHTLINLPGDHRDAANARRDWVIQRLRGGGMNVLDAITMGSIPRLTALEGHADVDVMAVLHYGQHISGHTPAQVLMATKTALGIGAGSIRRNGQAVTITFQSWPNVDVVPAARLGHEGRVTGFEIPDMNRGEWLPSNPPQHGRDMAAAASVRGPNFRQVIKMLKDWNRRQTVRLQSYHIEVIALQLDVDWSDHSWPIYQWFEAAQPAIGWLWHADADVSAYLSYDQANKARAQLLAAHGIALQGWHNSYNGKDREAIIAFRSIFGLRFPNYG